MRRRSPHAGKVTQAWDRSLFKKNLKCMRLSHSSGPQVGKRKEDGGLIQHIKPVKHIM